jgi:HAD superfamily hydrolase (TIGR01484 family)
MKIIFSDFDGTLTTANGRLDAAFHDLLALIEKHKSQLVIVSGRSVSWGHFLLTHLPLKYVIMEGGGVVVSKNMKGELSEEILLYDESVTELELLTQKLLKEFPDTPLSLDSFGRKTDRAIEYHQMSKEAIQEVESFLQANGASFSRSNVHINFWLGDISKNYAVEYFLKHYTPHIKAQECIYYGDSLNDESMFANFPNTVGVSNIINVIDQLDHRPKIILEGKENAGIYGVLTHLKEVFNQSVDF